MFNVLRVFIGGVVICAPRAALVYFMPAPKYFTLVPRLSQIILAFPVALDMFENSVGRGSQTNHVKGDS